MVAGIFNNIEGVYVLKHGAMQALVVGVSAFKVGACTVGMVHA